MISSLSLRFERAVHDNSLLRASWPAVRTLLGLRPEHLGLTTRADHLSIKATVRQSESTGATTYVSVEALGTNLQLALPGHVAVSSGQQMNLSATPESIHLFDAETGMRRVDL